MANKIFRNLKPQAHLSRNGFDKSFLHNFTAKIGELLPVACVETVPGGHYEFKVSDFLRTIPMNNAAFIRATQHFELYFVPYKQLWHYWDDFYTTRGVPQSTVLSRKNFKGAPNMYLSNIFDETLDAKISQYQTPYFLDVFGNPVGYGMDKIENLLGYRGSYGLTPDDTVRFGNLRPNVFRAAAYQKICFDYYRQPYYDLPDDFTAYQFNLDDCGESGSVDAAITIDNVTVPRSNLLFRLNYRQWKKDLFTGTLPSTQFGAVSVVDVAGGIVDVDEEKVLDITTDNTRIIGALASDTPTPVRVSTDGSLVDNSGIPLSLGSSNNSGNHLHNIFAEDLAGSLGNGALTSSNGTFDILSLVRASAIQQWRENTLRAGFRNTSQYEGHFGVTPIFTDKDKCVFIDSVSSPLMVNSVTNTSAQGDVALGDLAANAKSSLDGRKMKFDAKDFGVLMCIYSMLPEASYTSLSLEPMNAKVERDDFFTPEYENIGLQPVSNIFANLLAGASNTLMGYVPRYAEYKIGIDRNSAEFSDVTNLFAGAFAGWSPNRYVPSEMSIGDFYVNPEYYSDIFVVKPTPQSNTDTFIHQCYFDIKCVLPMSVLGLPNY